MPTLAEEGNGVQKLYPAFFKSLAELDDWASLPKVNSDLHGILPFISRSDSQEEVQARGKLLICHDYKGGYTESSASLSYTFNFWERCDTFIYFSHHRVTVPPPGWITAAHRQGVKMLGVLIFEHQESMEDCLRLLVGKLPKSRTGQVTPLGNQLPVSPHYAKLLADLARERGFDGYLLNFEFPFPGRSEQARAIEAWISLLRSELKRTVGEHAETIWYDSIITTGDLRWQDRLNSLNVNFFLASDAFFTNYTWPHPFPSQTAQYFLSLEPSLIQGRTRSLQDVYIGLDVWGRGSHGNGGFGSYKAIEHVDPQFMGLSIAVFGPAWSWESEEGKEDWNWEKWWAYERKLWIGSEREGEKVEVPDAPQKRGEPPCIHGEFKPISSFFEHKAPPNPSSLPFYTAFCPGVGFSWFIEGKKVMHKDSGWTDVDKQTSLGNLLWPRPSVQWEETMLDEPLPSTSTSLRFGDAYNGGSSLIVKLSGSDVSEAGFFRCFWVPVQSLSITAGKAYVAELIYKIVFPSGEVDLAVSGKANETSQSVAVIPIAGGTTADLPNGWNKSSVRLEVDGKQDRDIFIAVGFVLGAIAEDASRPYEIDIQLGQMNVYPSAPSDISPYHSRLLWADSTSAGESPNTLTISWETCVAFSSPASITDLSRELTRPPWILDRSPQWFPSFLYFNIFAQPRKSDAHLLPSEDAVFIGTSGSSGVRNSFTVIRDALPIALQKNGNRFYVQGVTDRGAVMAWESCVFVDVE